MLMQQVNCEVTLLLDLIQFKNKLYPLEGSIVSQAVSWSYTPNYDLNHVHVINVQEFQKHKV